VIKLKGSCDPVTGEIYVPPRTYAADGSLRRCEPLAVDGSGTLYSWTTFRNDAYGIIDLACGGRVQAYLGEGPHEIGTRYVAKDLVVANPIERARFYRD
jgi:uncharacterized OB-fold protein